MKTRIGPNQALAVQINTFCNQIKAGDIVQARITQKRIKKLTCTKNVHKSMVERAMPCKHYMLYSQSSV